MVLITEQLLVYAIFAEIILYPLPFYCAYTDYIEDILIDRDILY